MMTSWIGLPWRTPVVLIALSFCALGSPAFSQNYGMVDGQELTNEAVEGVNALSRSVGGTKVIPGGLHYQQQHDGYELQMAVLDDVGRRWILGAEKISGAASSKICLTQEGRLCQIGETEGEEYGKLYHQVLSKTAGETINTELSRLEASIDEIQIKISNGDRTVIVAWKKLEGGSKEGSFILDLATSTVAPRKGNDSGG